MTDARATTSIDVPESCVVQTPQALAHAMIKALGRQKTDTWLEPCVGNGALLKALSQIGVEKKRITGLDVDARPRPNDRYGNVTRGTEFLRWSRNTELRFDKVVANPPYVALERLDAAIRQAAIDASLSESVRVTGNGNAWYAFLCASIRLLNTDGSLCFLLPAAWDYANYASSLREAISAYFSSVEIFRTTTPIFRAEGVQEGAIVLLAKGRRAATAKHSEARRVVRHVVSSLDELLAALESSPVESRASHPLTSVSSPVVLKRTKSQPLSELIKINLGTVTGDSSYFLLSESRRRELRLPRSSVKPVLSKAKHLSSPKMTTVQWNLLKEGNERVWLFNPSVRLTENRFVQSYLDFGLNGGCAVDNHKISIRTPWFRCPDLGRCDAFLSGMSAAMPALTLSEMPGLTATNTLYSVTFLGTNLRDAHRLNVAMSLLLPEVRAQMRAYGRAYAAGLLKHEPSDLLKLMVPKIGDLKVTWADYRAAFRALKEGDEVLSGRIAASCRR